MSNKQSDRLKQQGIAKEDTGKHDHVESLFDVFEKLGKIVAAGLVVCYGMGMLITNLYLSNVIGASDLEAIRAKFISTGFIYFIYLLIPVLLFTVPFRCWQYSYNKLRVTKFWRVILASISAVFVASTIVVLVPIMLHYFIPFIKYSLHSDGNTTCTSLDFIVKCVNIFWRLYFSHSILGSIVVSLVICAYYYKLEKKARDNSLWKFKNAIIIVAVLNFSYQIFFFWENVYSNIDDCIGGGNPRVMIRLKQGQLLPAGSQYYSNCGDGILLPALLMYMGKDFTYIMPSAEGKSKGKCLNVVAIRTDAIEGLSNLNACVRRICSRSSSTYETYSYNDDRNIWIVKPSIEIELCTTNGISAIGITKTKLECSLVTSNSTLLVAGANDAIVITHPNGYSTLKTDLTPMFENLHTYSVRDLIKENMAMRFMIKDCAIKEIRNVSLSLWVNGTTRVSYSLTDCKKDQFGAYCSLNFNNNRSNFICSTNVTSRSLSNYSNASTNNSVPLGNFSTNATSID